MKKKLIALVLILVMVLTFGLVACAEPTDTSGIETSIADLQAKIVELKNAVTASETDLTEVEALLAELEGLQDIGAIVEQLTAIVDALEAANTADAAQAANEAAAIAYKTFVANPTWKVATGKFYGGVHNGYLGEARVTTDANGITDVKFSEYFLPNTYATKSTATTNNGWTTDGAAPGTTNLKVAATDMVENLAKYIMIGQSLFELQNDGANGTNNYVDFDGRMKGVPVYKQINNELTGVTNKGIIGVTNGSSILIADLTKFITTNQAGAAWYVSNLGTITRGQTDGTKGTVTGCEFSIMTTTTVAGEASAQVGTGTGAVLLKKSGVTAEHYSNQVDKAQGYYWALGGSYALGWIGNFDIALSNFAKSYLTTVHYTELAKVNGSPVFTAANGVINTGATATDFKTYYALCQGALLNALR